MRTEHDALAIGGVAASELARAYGTPLLAIDTDVLDATVAWFAAAGERSGIDVYYAGKALLFVALARRIAASGLGIDVCSYGELLTVERAGIPPARLVMHGCGKTDAELDAIAAGRVGRVVVDHVEELAALASRATNRAPISVLLRLNTGVAARTHAHVRTGGEESKFGFSRESLDRAIAFAVASDGIALAGVHGHLGSQLFDAEPYAESVAVLVDAFARMRAAGAAAHDLVVGGGFGVDGRPGGERLDVDHLLREIRVAVTDETRARGLAMPRIGIEPGRAIVATAGTSLYRVVAVKRHGERRFAIVDGSMADNPRPALYDAYHHPVLAGRASRAAFEEFTVCGRSCESDRLVVAPLPADLATGDLLAVGTAGAYTYSMASNYNRFAKPGVAFAGRGEHRLVVRRERDDDVLRNDVDDPA